MTTWIYDLIRDPTWRHSAVRKGKKGGKCAVCGLESEEGLFWEPFYFTTDFGVLKTPLEFHDMSQPERCDECESKAHQQTVSEPIDD